MKNYRHIFFDLDHTIWDFDRNAEETLKELYMEYKLSALGVPSAELFIAKYTENNHRLWAEYHSGKITKDHLREMRFKQTFLDLGMLPDLIPIGFEDHYVRVGPTKTGLFDGAHEVLTYLKERYTLHLISNGFIEAVTVKVAGSDLARYFDNVIVSEVVGVIKPDRRIFEHALQLAGATIGESLMIGDSLEADVYGALNFGMDAIWFNPAGLPTPDDVPVQVNSLRELVGML
ncbi:YjjG family noncanonical pyrimidine nucleotidase [Mucilaginibacter ginkgonis]|uniref:YjjG family noncanonical pyrimidine nucleotidase n=1 Tax=Mucilaginibacter ginkgonis TaxID=2682091 RepID=A0A7T7F8P2_9SPHI|nr:YjjG family noncanonical pyrimidine nucleotidase [Mucilaginibacter ginkgonis]QQL48817.1 YjjG family noncanonical pyrimidine nucleotidase [Mucilaginibacter ginkgonis]